MDHSLTMNVDQPPSNTSQLEGGTNVNKVMTVRHWVKTYKPELIYIWMCLHKFTDVSICHPL